MKIKIYWPKCDLSYNNFHFMRIDSFWVECTPKEGEKKIFPYLNQNQIAESKSYYEPKNKKINKYGFKTDRLCFLVSKDLKTIVPFPWYYPYSGQWNAYCPFVEIKEIEIEELSEIIDSKQ